MCVCEVRAMASQDLFFIVYDRILVVSGESRGYNAFMFKYIIDIMTERYLAEYFLSDAIDHTLQFKLNAVIFVLQNIGGNVI